MVPHIQLLSEAATNRSFHFDQFHKERWPQKFGKHQLNQGFSWTLTLANQALASFIYQSYSIRFVLLFLFGQFISMFNINSQSAGPEKPAWSFEKQEKSLFVIKVK